MDDLGAPSSYLALKPGAAVYALDGTHVGKVEHVLAAPDEDIFDGIVLDKSVLPGGHRFVDGSQVKEIFERGVELKIDGAAAERLPEPSENAATMEISADDLAASDEHQLKNKLSRAWDLISGKG